MKIKLKEDERPAVNVKPADYLREVKKEPEYSGFEGSRIVTIDALFQVIGDIKDGERVFDERRSLIFKTLQVVRFFDRKRNVLVYVAYSDRFIEGSPKNSISSVPIMAWPEQ